MATAQTAPAPSEPDLIERFRSAFHDLSELAQHSPAAADTIAAAVAAQLRSAFPMQQVTHAAPITGVRVPVAGGVYELTAVEGGMLLYVQEPGGRDAALTVPAVEFVKDACAVGKAVAR
jgi:hypothetical protein